MIDYRVSQWRAAGKDVELRWIWRELDQISPNLRRAVVVAEDSSFWEHQGFDWESLRAAWEKNRAQGNYTVGGSTITQQLAKNLYLSPSKSLTRKAREAILAWRLERNLSKARILELYLNVVEWDEGVFGAEAAALNYYKTSVTSLSRQQAATLAALLPGPLMRDPGQRHVQRVAAIIQRRM